MQSLFAFLSSEFVALHGYWALALLVGLESVGIPVPGETALITAAALAGATHGVNIYFVVLAAAGGAIVGDSIGFWIGRKAGFPLLKRYGARIGITEKRIKLGRYLFDRHGGKLVFFGRFIALLRTLAAFLAGASRMHWPRFLMFNAAGGIVWASLFGAIAYFFGGWVKHLTLPLGIGLLAVGCIVLGLGFLQLKRRENEMLDRAERAYPGPV
jgi:membrane protein DedA with SNARE-associated domain